MPVTADSRRPSDRNTRPITSICHSSIERERSPNAGQGLAYVWPARLRPLEPRVSVMCADVPASRFEFLDAFIGDANRGEGQLEQRRVAWLVI